MMRALVQNGYGGPEVLALADLPEPGAPGPGRVAIAVHAAGLHAGDIWIMRGEPLLIRAAFGRKRPRQPVVGRDVVGLVTATGDGVTTLAVGDRVFVESDQAGFAETVVADARFVRRAPANLDDVHAAVIPVSGTTALQGLRLAGVGPGDRVLVIGASGNRDMAGIEFLSNCPKDKGVQVGVLDIRTNMLETPDQVAARVRTVLKHLSPEQVTLSSDCGLKPLPRMVAKMKLKALAQGAAIVRKEIS
jgi:D-arabinose 1-dehydrogenase-like Zn-dependent alcohol dehydrogenase